jgi:hypothetical protein
MDFAKNLWHPKVVQVVSVQLIENGNSYYFVRCSLKKGEFFADEIDTFEDKQDLLKKMHKSQPLVLHFFGKGILNRKVDDTPDYIEKIIVNSKKTEFYFSELSIEPFKYISFTRKDHISSELDFFKEEGYMIMDASLGPFVSQSEALPKRFNETPTCEIRRTNSQSFDFKIKPALEETKLPFEFKGWQWGKGLYAGLLAFLYLEGESFPSFFEEDQKTVAKSNFTDKKQFEFLGVFTLAFFLIALTVNYMYQGSISKENAELEDDITIYSDNLNRIDFLHTEIERKSQLIRTSGILNYRFFSFYLDQIGSTISKDIRLTELSVFPLINKLKQKKRPEFAQSNILISGLAISSTSLENWLKKVDALAWVSKSEIIYFAQKKEKIGVFTVKIFLR